MCIWPFMMGHLLELPLTMVEDYTLTAVLCERTPRVWLQKIEFIEQYLGMALMNTHPDYLRDPITWQVYAGLLHEMKERSGYWHALPSDVARWWRARAGTTPGALDPRLVWGHLVIDKESHRLVLAHDPERTSHSLPAEVRKGADTHPTTWKGP